MVRRPSGDTPVTVGRQMRIRARTAAISAALAAAVAAAFGAGCGRSAVPVSETAPCADRFVPGSDAFPDKVTVDDAVGFTVSYHGSFKTVRVREAYPGGPAETYVLVPCGAPVPPLEGELAGAQLVMLPVTSLFAASPTHLALLAGLRRLDVLTGVSRLRDLAGEDITAALREGQVREFAPRSVIDAELVVSARPGLLMASGVLSPALATLRRAGVPVVANTEYLEPTALARAEWIKFMALFLDEERHAQAFYAGVKDRYRALSARATAVPEARRPLVMTGRANRGDFVIAGGRSYVAALIRDAGARYVWHDNTAVASDTVDIEAQVRRAANADFWINGGGWSSRQQMVTDEPRYAEFKAFRNGQVWVYERRMTPDGGNDYWSRGVARPDLVLADLIAIFHPALLPGHALEWYMQVPAQ